MWLALASVLLASCAQLAQKWGIVRLPPLSEWWPLAPGWWGADPAALAALAAGIAAYALSLLCWLGALARLPLNRAYPLLGLSYALVYFGAVALPWYHEAFSARGAFGVALVCVGVVLCSRG